MRARALVGLLAVKARYFVAWDGEGLTRRNGQHDYVLLANSEGLELWDARRGGLSTVRILDALVDGARSAPRGATHVIFSGSYDVNCWLRDVAPARLEALWNGATIEIEHAYKVQYRARRVFTVRRLRDGARLVLWDVWGFFQGTFLSALARYGVAAPPEIAKGKAARGRFTARQRGVITRYCRHECTALVHLMVTLNEALQEAGIPVSRWEGAGACAASLLRREGVRAAMGESPAVVQRAAQYAYAGGRIELLQYGHAPRSLIHHYDINSAYPAAMRDVPDLSAGGWERTRESSALRAGFALALVRWNFRTADSYAFPFFWRDPRGLIYYPSRGEGWYWAPELDAALDELEAGRLRGRVEIVDGYRYEPDRPDARPFAWIDRVYEDRARFKREGRGAQHALKLAINSLYGKTAQHVGGRGAAPAWHQLEWAGYITSRTRAALWRAAQGGGAATVALATDGIFSTAPLDLPTAPGLGSWSYEQHHGATFVQSGVYWVGGSRRDARAEQFSRGFDRGSLSRRGVVRAWERGRLSHTARLTRFVTMGPCVAGQRPWADWRKWLREPRALALIPDGTKRAARTPASQWGRRTEHPARGLARTVPAFPAALVVGGALSSPYRLPWVDGPGLPDREREYWESAALDIAE